MVDNKNAEDRKRQQTAARQARFRERKAQAGIQEVRGIFAPMAAHEHIKWVVREILEAVEKKQK